MQLRVRRGLKFIPVPKPAGTTAPPVRSVAIACDEHTDLKPSLQAEAGAAVAAGEVLFRDRTDPAIRFVAPLAGRVVDIRMGPRRRLRSVVIEVDHSRPSPPVFAEPIAGLDELEALPMAELRHRLQGSGLWPAIRQRPGDGLAPSAGIADVVLVSAIDTHPWSIDPSVLLEGRWEAFWLGVAALARFARHATWVCAGPDFPLPPAGLNGRAHKAVFAGPHPAGLTGTHLGRLAPLSPGRTAWHVDSQDAAMIGACLRTGQLSMNRRIGVTGPALDHPVTVELPCGSDVTGLVDDGSDLVCGSVLAGRPAEEPYEHLGRFHRQVTVLPQGWAGEQLFSRSFSRPGAGLALYGGTRRVAGGMLPSDTLDRIWALETPPAPLLRALMTGDYDRAATLGCLDLGEEDMALASLLCPGGHDYGRYLGQALAELRPERSP